MPSLVKVYFGTIPALLLFFVLGCAMLVSPLTPEQIAGADYGTVPVSSTYQQAIKDYMQGILFDPYTAHYRFLGKPQKGYAYISGTMKPPVFGYLVHVGIDAKNLRGRYVGEEPYRFFIKNEALYMLDKSVTAEIVQHDG